MDFRKLEQIGVVPKLSTRDRFWNNMLITVLIGFGDTKLFFFRLHAGSSAQPDACDQQRRRGSPGTGWLEEEPP